MYISYNHKYIKTIVVDDEHCLVLMVMLKIERIPLEAKSGLCDPNKSLSLYMYIRPSLRSYCDRLREGHLREEKIQGKKLYINIHVYEFGYDKKSLRQLKGI